MTTLEVTPQPATASVAITVNPTYPVLQLIREDANGVHPVRTAAGVLPITTSMVVIDYEPALSGPISYTIVDAGFPDPPPAVTALDLPGEWLTVPALPALSVQVDPRVGRTAYNATRAGTSIVHDVIDRADQPVTLGVLRLRAGTFDVWAPDHPGARTVEGVYAHGEVVLLRQQIPGMDMYHVAMSTGVTPQLPTARYLVSVTFQEVPYPTTNLIGTLGWTFDDVLATYATFAALPTIYATFNDLTIGPTS